jgi:hypothetical protein
MGRKQVVPTRLMKLLAIAALAFAVVFAAQSGPPSAVDAAPVPVVKKDDDYNPHNTRIKPYKYEHEQGRYTSESTKMPSTAPCAVIGTDPAGWPKGIASCYGPPPAPKPAPKPKPSPAPRSAQATPPAAAPSGTGGNGGGSAPRAQQPKSSCG